MVNNIIRKYLSLTKEFGANFVWRYLFSKIFKGNESVNEVIEEKLMPIYVNSINNSDDGVEHTSLNAWSLWWQGEDSMPDMVRICYQSQLRYVNSHLIKYNLLTKDNINEFIDIPDYILRKVNEKKISLTHLSDIIRIILLEEYGGVWIDLTLLFNKQLTPSIFNHEFFSFKLDPKLYTPIGFGQKLTACKWSGFFLAASAEHSHIFSYLKSAILSYWEIYDYLIDYFLMNRLLKMAYNKDVNCKSTIDNVPYSNNNLYRLLPMINMVYDKQEYEMLCHQTTCFKLSYKIDLKKCVDGKKTYYGHLYETYLKDKDVTK